MSAFDRLMIGAIFLLLIRAVWIQHRRVKALEHEIYVRNQGWRE